jgi:hypothetical protein
VSEQRETTSNPQPPRRAVTPLKAFALVSALILLAATALYLTSRAQGGPPEVVNTEVTAAVPTSTPPPLLLTDGEAASRFKELHSIAIEAIRSRRVHLLDEAFTSDGSGYRRSARIIRGLVHDNVRDRTQNVLRSITVLESSEAEITIAAASAIEPCFLDESGTDVTDAPGKVWRLSHWTLRPQNSRWLIHDAVVRKQRIRSSRSANC